MGVNTNTELIHARAQEVIDILCELPFVRLRRPRWGNHPLKIKERVFDSAEHGIAKLNTETGVETLLKFLEETVFYNDPMTDRYKMWQDLSSP